jgi:hypothetical protein
MCQQPIALHVAFGIQDVQRSTMFTQINREACADLANISWDAVNPTPAACRISVMHSRAWHKRSAVARLPKAHIQICFIQKLLTYVSLMMGLVLLPA